MTGNRTTELREKLTEHGVKHEDSELTDFNDGTTTYYTEWGGNDDGDGANVYVEYVDGTVLRMFDATPEQAIAATLGSKPDETELTQTYDAGFGNGVMAVFQQLEGIEDYEGLQELIAAWNARVERTCRDVSVDSSTQFYCSECECTVDVPLLWGEINFCPNCGARVIGTEAGE